MEHVYESHVYPHLSENSNKRGILIHFVDLLMKKYTVT